MKGFMVESWQWVLLTSVFNPGVDQIIIAILCDKLRKPLIEPSIEYQ